MKYFYFVCVCFALVAYISAKPSYLGNVGYRGIPLGLPSALYGARAPIYSQPIVNPLVGVPAAPKASAAAAAAASALNPGLYSQYAVPQYDIISGVPGLGSNYGPILSTY